MAEEPVTPNKLPSLILGMGAVIAGHILFPGAVFLVEMAVNGGTTGLWLGLGMALGVVQVLWVLPLAIWAKKTGRNHMLQGILIMAGLAFLANSACWGLLLTSSALFH